LRFYHDFAVTERKKEKKKGDSRRDDSSRGELRKKGGERGRVLELESDIRG